MRLLIITQAVDSKDPVVGFFHSWIEEFSKKYEKITIICLKKGQYDLPQTVEIFSLGKEEKISRLTYILRFYKYIWTKRKNYETVFVHMNQEYVLLGGILWKLLGKKITMWRNHSKGSFLTRIAIMLSDKVFCTSNESFTARYKKTHIMPVGIDTKVFTPDMNVLKENGSILFLSRISPVKKLDLVIQALNILDQENVSFKLSVYGDPIERDKEYYEKIRQESNDLMKKGKVIFYKAIPNIETPKIYNNHEIFVNATEGGSFDKTLLEAAASECLLITSNKAVTNIIPKEFLFEESNINDLAKKLKYALSLSTEEKEKIGRFERSRVLEHDLSNLSAKLFLELKTLENKI